MRTPATILKGGDSGSAAIKGDAAKSLLVHQVSTQTMPPGKATKLTEAETQRLRDWIKAGLPSALAAVAPDGLPWSFQPIKRPVPPTVSRGGLVRTPVDPFLLDRLEREKLSFTPEADSVTLIRRLTLDLLGLPPTPEEVDAFIKESSAKPQAAYEALVERLLASPHYGERWGRHWLDLARFSESQGYERDKPRDHSWPYRDYVIRSFNEDKPYPQFIREQIAGDVLEPVTSEGIVASAFLVCGPWDEVGQSQQGVLMRLRVREEELEDMIGVVGQTFLGLTVNCARCHNHKFDPIPQKDYYRIKAALDGVRAGDRPSLTPDRKRERDKLLSQSQKAIAELEKKLATLERAGRTKVREAPGQAGVAGLLARWSFDNSARDSVGELHGSLQGTAKVDKGRLILDGKGGYLKTEALTRDLQEKTLEAWVALSNLQQRGGGVLTVESGEGKLFDAIVFGERDPGRWIAGSEFHRRTMDYKELPEGSGPDTLVHLAIVYGNDNSITIYRNGDPYGVSYKPSGDEAWLRTYPANEARVLMGLRHKGAGNGFLAAEVEEARLYNRALTGEEVRASFRGGPDMVPLERALEALDPADRRLHERETKILKLERLRAQEIADFPKVYGVTPKAPEATYVLLRGDVEKKGDPVTAGGLSTLKSLPADFGLTADTSEGQRRIKLADWIASPDNPLTFRVMANRLWHHHFGQGLVATPSDFGTLGDPPSHPELLDYLASELVHSGGSVKHLHRLIVLSSAYRQGNRWNENTAKVDGDNRLLWRFAPRRLEGETVRDAMLRTSGQLNPRLGGSSFRPFNATVFNSTFYTLTDPPGAEFNRRTVYRMNVNSAKSPLLDSLDCPDPSVKSPRRATTTTPIQALGLMNNVFVHRQAKALADRARSESGEDIGAQVGLAYRLALGRGPTKAESDRAVAAAREYGLETVAWALFNSSEFLYLR